MILGPILASAAILGGVGLAFGTLIALVARQRARGGGTEAQSSIRSDGARNASTDPAAAAARTNATTTAAAGASSGALVPYTHDQPDGVRVYRVIGEEATADRVRVALDKLEEETRELREAMASPEESRQSRLEDEIGDILFVIVNLARFLLTLEQLGYIQSSNGEFRLSLRVLDLADPTTRTAVLAFEGAKVTALYESVWSGMDNGVPTPDMNPSQLAPTTGWPASAL